MDRKSETLVRADGYLEVRDCENPECFLATDCPIEIEQ